LHKALRSATVQFAQAAQDRAGSPAQQQAASPAAGRQPSSRPPARQQAASPAAGRQPGSRPPARQQDASPGSQAAARQQIASPAAGRQPSSRPPARQEAASPAADHRPGSYVIYAPARAGAPAPRRSNVPACVLGRAGTARAPAGYAGSEARKLGRFVIFFGISVWAGRKKWGLKLSGKG
jgi:hypothetical protein